MAKNASEREETKRFRDLRKQLIRIKKDNAQLRKRNHYLEGLLLEAEENDLEEEIEKFTKYTKPVKSSPEENILTCPSCGSTTVKEMVMRGIRYFKCPECGSKGKL